MLLLKLKNKDEIKKYNKEYEVKYKKRRIEKKLQRFGKNLEDFKFCEYVWCKEKGIEVPEIVKELLIKQIKWLNEQRRLGDNNVATA